MLSVRLFLSTCLRHKHDAFVPLCHHRRSHHSIPNSSSSTSRSTTAPRGCLCSSSESGGNGYDITVLHIPTLLSQGSPAVNGRSPVLRHPESRKTLDDICTRPTSRTISGVRQRLAGVAATCPPSGTSSPGLRMELAVLSAAALTPRINTLPILRLVHPIGCRGYVLVLHQFP